MAVMAPRESWTDERLYEFAKRMDERFDDVDRRFDETNQRMDERFAEVNRRLDQVDRRMEAMLSRFDRLTIALVVGLLGIIATRL
jgi:tetrahydromethanopterin S-methyltransferase subunit G